MAEPAVCRSHPPPAAACAPASLWRASIRRAATCAWALTLTLLLCAPASLWAQSVDLLRAYQNYETARAANNVPDALRYGDEALALQADSGEPQDQIALLRNLGEFCVQAGRDPEAVEYFQRALALQEAQLGSGHPDLVPVLSALAHLAIRARRYADADALLQRELAIERAAYGEHHANVVATLHELRELYGLTDNAEGVSRIDAQLQPPAPPTRGLSAPVGITSKSQHYPRSEGQGGGFATVRVFYGTNRAATGELKPALFYGKARGELQYGYLDVTIPNIHKEAELETQSRWTEFDLSVTPATLRSRYILLDKVTPLARDEFVGSLRQQIKAAPSRDVFIFVHGFNNTFEDAARRTAQLAYDLDFDGTPIMYSWPSQGSVTAYAVDSNSVGISGRKLAEFLDTVVSQSGAERIHLIAHSMGNRALIEALQTYLAKRAPNQRQNIFGQVVFTAPDVDRDYFIDAIGTLRGSAERVTLYASNNDHALQSSQYFNGAPRAGTAGQYIIRMLGLDTIDMSAVPADMLGHNYFAANDGALFDMFRLLWRGDPPPRRCGMNDYKEGGPVPFWRFDASVCKGDEMLEAGLLLKRFGALARARVEANMSSVTDASQKQQWALILQRLDTLIATVGLPAGGSGR